MSSLEQRTSTLASEYQKKWLYDTSYVARSLSELLLDFLKDYETIRGEEDA